MTTADRDVVRLGPHLSGRPGGRRLFWGRGACAHPTSTRRRNACPYRCASAGGGTTPSGPCTPSPSAIRRGRGRRAHRLRPGPASLETERMTSDDRAGRVHPPRRPAVARRAGRPRRRGDRHRPRCHAGLTPRRRRDRRHSTRMTWPAARSRSTRPRGRRDERPTSTSAPPDRASRRSMVGSQASLRS